jgi:hypothetical protein
MDRNVPNCLLEILEHWFSICSTCVRWGQFVSRFVNLSCGVRQGGVLSPHLFSIYVDDVIDKITRSKTGCNLRSMCISIFMYADDLLILSPSVTYLQRLIRLVELELIYLDMPINVSKSMCIRVGPRHNIKCADITAYNGTIIPWVNDCQYLGIYIMSGSVFKCDFAYTKKSLFRSFNALFGKIGHRASADVIVHLVKSKCFPIFLYALEACPVNKTETKSFDFALFRIYAKVFGTFSNEIISECQSAFNLSSAINLINRKKINFLKRFVASENQICKTFDKNANSELASLKRLPWPG